MNIYGTQSYFLVTFLALLDRAMVFQLASLAIKRETKRLNVVKVKLAKRN